MLKDENRQGLVKCAFPKEEVYLERVALTRPTAPNLGQSPPIILLHVRTIVALSFLPLQLTGHIHWLCCF